MTGTMLLLSTCELDDNIGRAEKFRARKRILEALGWTVVIEYVPETAALAIPSSIRSGVKTATREDVDVVVAPSSPWHIQVIGLGIQLRTGRPLVAEFRDPLVMNPNAATSGPKHWFRRVLEWVVVHRADRVVWWDGIQLPEGYFEQRYDLPSDRVRQLPFMGFDAINFQDVPASSNDEFTIIYAGSFYDGWIEPYAFLDGLRAYLDEYPERSVAIQIYGDWTEDYQDHTEAAGLSDVVHVNGFVDHDVLVPALKGADASLYIGGLDDRNRLNIPSKVWDYIGAGTPILAVVDPRFRSAEFVRSNELGVVADPRDENDIATAIAEIRNWEGLSQAKRSPFMRKNAETAFANVLNEVV